MSKYCYVSTKLMEMMIMLLYFAYVEKIQYVSLKELARRENTI